MGTPGLAALPSQVRRVPGTGGPASSGPRVGACEVGRAGERGSGAAIAAVLAETWSQQLWPSNIWVNYNELTTSSLEIIVSKGNHPQMAQQFRLVNYYNLQRNIWIPENHRKMVV